MPLSLSLNILSLCQTLTNVKIKGRIREDVMTLAMIGPVLEIESFEILES
ncbi:hypothetical protein [Aphanothece sacrum]|nr:hypothetical protein [Aphanothece sacrum]